MLISYGESIFGESEEACAERWRLLYGLERAMTLARVYVKTTKARPFQAYWRGVESHLGQFTVGRGNQKHLTRKEEKRGGWHRRFAMAPNRNAN